MSKWWRQDLLEGEEVNNKKDSSSFDTRHIKVYISAVCVPLQQPHTSTVKWVVWGNEARSLQVFSS